MFDTTIVKQAPAYPQTIHEHRAPTDESVRLLNEMQSEAKVNIIKNIIVDDNVVNGSITIMQDYYSMGKKYVVYFKFNLNGRDYVIDKIFEADSLDKNDVVLRKFYEEFSKIVTAKLFDANIAAFKELL